MIRLVGAELSRLRARRMTLVVLLALLVGVGLLLFGTNLSVTPPSASDVASAQQSYQQDRTELLQECLSSGQSQQECEEQLPQLSDYLPTVQPFGEAANFSVMFGGLFAMLAGYLLAASAIGAEYGTGAIANWLTFVPERFRVLGAKLLAVAIGTAVVGAVVTGLALGGTVVLVSIHEGTVAGVGTVAAMAGRAVVLVVVASLLGFCLALLTRHTGAAIGIILGYLVISTVLSALIYTIPALADLPPWLPDRNLTAFLDHGTTYQVYPNGEFDGEPIEKKITFAHSAVYWAVLLAVTVAASAAVFRRRDVT